LTISICKAKCRACGNVTYPPRKRCPSCGSNDLDSVALEGPATLMTYTRVHMLSLAYTERYITLGIVEFPDGTRALGRLYVDEPRIGMKINAETGTVRVEGFTEYKGLRLTAA
jgi:uncharacterized OB-fold protein